MSTALKINKSDNLYLRLSFWSVINPRRSKDEEVFLPGFLALSFKVQRSLNLRHALSSLREEFINQRLLGFLGKLCRNLGCVGRQKEILRQDEKK